MKKAILFQLIGFLSLVGVLYPEIAGISQTDSVQKKDTVTPLVIKGLRAADSANKTFDKILFKKQKKQKPKIQKVYIMKEVEVPIHDTTVIHDTIANIGTKYVPMISKDEYHRVQKWATDTIAALRKQIKKLTPKPKKKHKFLFL